MTWRVLDFQRATYNYGQASVGTRRDIKSLDTPARESCNRQTQYSGPHEMVVHKLQSGRPGTATMDGAPDAQLVCMCSTKKVFVGMSAPLSPRVSEEHVIFRVP